MRECAQEVRLLTASHFCKRQNSQLTSLKLSCLVCAHQNIGNIIGFCQDIEFIISRYIVLDPNSLYLMSKNFSTLLVDNYLTYGREGE